MSSLNKLFLAALCAFSGVAANAHTGAEQSSFKAKSVIASHETAPALSSVVQRARHRHHHVKHRGHTVRQVR